MKNYGNSKNNNSGVKGVFFSKLNKKWTAQIPINGKKKHLGYHVDFDETVCHRFAAEQCLGWDKYNSNSPAYQYIKENIQW